MLHLLVESNIRGCSEMVSRKSPKFLFKVRILAPPPTTFLSRTYKYMSKKVNIKNSKIQDKSWQDNIFLYIIISVIIGIIIIGITNYLRNNMNDNTKSKVNIENSSIEKSNLVVDSPNSVNIVGDNNVVNKVNLPKPEFKGTIQSQNMINENLYQTEIMLEILSQLPLQKIQIGIINPNIISIDVNGSLQDVNQISSEGQSFISFKNAFGSYIVIVKTKNSDPDILSKIKINYQ